MRIRTSTKPKLLTLFALALLTVPMGVLGLDYAFELLAVDRCLDRGGAFEYSTVTCSTDPNGPHSFPFVPYGQRNPFLVLVAASCWDVGGMALAYATWIRHRHRCLLLLAATTTCHFLIGCGLFLWVFSSEMGRFDTGAPPSSGEEALSAMVSILQFPATLQVSALPPQALPGLTGYLPFAANSLAWGSLVTALLLRMRATSAVSRGV